MQPIEYDEQGRMKYHPDFHPNNGKNFTDEEKAYICYYIEHDSYKSIAMAVGRTELTIATLISKLRREELFNHYQILWKYIWNKGGWDEVNVDHLLEKGESLTHSDIEKLQENGHLNTVIAEAMGTTKSTVGKWMQFWNQNIS